MPEKKTNYATSITPKNTYMQFWGVHITQLTDLDPRHTCFSNKSKEDKSYDAPC